ncbi:unnamed protein product [Vicia faba]|uniref:Uncharacterized protein n=1 Tax=Vicia faba TaxID=3906 RepID=A0AAV1ASZ3_VICFA|nr:unnamed protein product [Vicia faba]
MVQDLLKDCTVQMPHKPVKIRVLFLSRNLGFSMAQSSLIGLHTFSSTYMPSFKTHNANLHSQKLHLIHNQLHGQNVLLPSPRIVAANHVDQDIQSDVVTSLYLLCCILRIVKIKDLANTIVAALYDPLESLTKCFGGQVNGMVPDNGFTSEGDGIDNNNNNLTKNNKKGLVVNVPCSPSSSGFHPQSITMLNNGSSSNVALRYLADQLTKVQLVNEVSKDFVIEALRSIAELITYGDQHDPSFFLNFSWKIKLWGILYVF